LPEPIQPDDPELVSRVVRGDRSAERELFRRHRGKVHATLYRVLGSNRDMDDLIQDAFVEIFRSLARFRGEAKLTTWIDRITVRVAYAHLSRRRGQTVSLELIAETPAEGAPDDERADAREGVRRLYAALATLGANARIAFALHAIEGRPIADVGRIMGTTALTAKLRIWRARRELARLAARDPVLAGFLTEEAA
jgi:RNA polymerase sigma-70 factor (ECF subfamily)